jgi:hypothetical protein
MRVSIPFVFFGAMLAVVLAAGIISSQPPAGKSEEPTKTIPLESCYATPEVSGCTHVKRGGGEAYSFDLEELIRGNNTGASNAALVHGKDIADAVKATRRVFASSAGAGSSVSPDSNDADTRALPLWMVAYFGMRPSRPGFGNVHAAEIRGRTVRVTFSRAHANKKSLDIRQYYFWAPLGKADAKSYALELFDAMRNEVMLLRRVVVAKS